MSDEMEAKKATKQEKFDAVTLVKSEKYRQWRDLLCVELDEGKVYSHSEVTNPLGNQP